MPGAFPGSADNSPPFERDELDSASEFSFRNASRDNFNGRKELPDESKFHNMGYQRPQSEYMPVVPQIKLTSVSNNESSASVHSMGQNLHFSKPRRPLYESEDPFTTHQKSPEEMQQTRLLEGAENTDPSHPQHRRDNKNGNPRADFDTRLVQAADLNRQQLESQVIRKINSGFEILRPGTLNRPQSHDETKLKGEGNWEKHLSRKLQRRSRDVSQPRESRFVEET